MKRFSEQLKNNEDYARLLLESEDYRAFLKCFFSLKKAFNPNYSYAVFARQADIAKSLPRDITEGLKRLTDKVLPQFVRAMEIDGLLEEFFIQLVASESDPSKLRLVKRLKDLYIETNFTKTYSDNNFEDQRAPFLYAASGEVGKGVSPEVLARRTGLTVGEVRAAIPNLEELRLGTYDRATDLFTPTTAHVHVVPEMQQSHFIDFFLYCLKLQQEQLREKFNSEGSLFYNEVFSVNEKDLVHLKSELKKTLKAFVMKAENANGDSVALLNLGFFKQYFSSSELRPSSQKSETAHEIH